MRSVLAELQVLDLVLLKWRTPIGAISAVIQRFPAGQASTVFRTMGVQVRRLIVLGGRMDVDWRQAALLTSYVDRAREGDAEAFAILAQRHYPVAMRLARRRTACVEDAEECCQEAMLSAWRSIGRFEGDSEAFVAWLVRIVDNRCADHWRRKNCRPRSVPFEWRRGEDTVTWVPVDRAPSPERSAERAEVRRNVDRLINEVPEPYASTLRMHHEGSTYVEIASSLEVPVGTVRSRLNRARAHMRGLVAASPELQVACTPRHWQWPRWRVPMLP